MAEVNAILQSQTYRCVVRNPAQGIEIRGVLIQPPAFSFESQWESFFQTDRAGSMSEKIVQQTIGKSLINRHFSAQSWAGSQHPVISISMGVVAMYSAVGEVLYPSAQALMTVLPTGTGMLTPPVNPKNSSDRYTVKIGRIITIRKLLPVSVEVTPEHVYAEDGAPIAATISMSFTPDKIPDKFEVLSWFGGGGGAGGGSPVAR